MLTLTRSSQNHAEKAITQSFHPPFSMSGVEATNRPVSVTPKGTMANGVGHWTGLVQQPPPRAAAGAPNYQRALYVSGTFLVWNDRIAVGKFPDHAGRDSDFDVDKFIIWSETKATQNQDGW